MDLLSHLRGVEDRPITKVHVEEWGCDVYLRPISAMDRMLIALAAANERDKHMIGLMTLAASLCDEQGNPVSPNRDEVISLLEKRNGAVIERLVRICFDLSGLSENAVEGIRKN
jgi:hypothetical protein